MITGNIDTLELNGVMDDYISLEGTMLTYGPKGDKGDKGDPGDPGFSPIAIVEQTSSGATITITDSVGTTSASVLNGADGQDGQDGVDGQDGFSPTASVTKSGSTATISITDKNGTTTATVSDGQNGSPGAPGQDGQDGEDGYSPSATVSKVGKIATITITDKDGTTTAEIRDGEDGQGSGDMLKATYDTNDNGIVDNAEKVNNHTVLTDVPADAVFTDTTYTAGTGIDITNGVISNTQTSAEWGNISGTLSDQTDLATALGGKADSSSLATVATSGSYTDLSNKPTIPTDLGDLTNNAGYIKNLFVAIYGTTTWTDVKNAIDNNKVVYCKVTSGSSYRMAFLAYYGSSSAEFQYYRSIDPHSVTQQGDQVFIYKITSSGTWSTTTREASVNIDVSDGLSRSYSNDKVTISGASKQDTLVSGTNIKTINNTSLLGSGNITISADDEVAIQTTQPTGNETVWINPTEQPAVEGASVVSTYSTGHDKVYDCDYLNNKFSTLQIDMYSSPETVVGIDPWGWTLYRKSFLIDNITTKIKNVNISNMIPGIALVEKIDYTVSYGYGETMVTGNTVITDGSTSIYSYCFYNNSGSAQALRFFFGGDSYSQPDYVIVTIDYIKG